MKSEVEDASAMCMMVYVASDLLLPTSGWDEAHPRFYVEELSARDEPVRRQFSKPYVYFAGSHEGCGCGFQYGQYEGIEEDSAEIAAARESRRLLSKFLSEALQLQPEVELFACWDGDQAATPKYKGRTRPDDLFRDRPFFRKKELLKVSEASNESLAPAPTNA